MLSAMSDAPDNADELFVPVDAEPSGSPLEVGLSLPRFFPSPTVTSLDGLVCVGGRLEPDRLLDAYRHGIFPWPVWDDEPMAWWSLDPRAILELDSLHISRRLQRTLRSGKFQVTCDRDFEGVIRGCATARGRRGNTWLTPAMIDAYLEMHRLGHAHSIEAWCRLPLSEETGPRHPHPNLLPRGEGTDLAGGVYGVATGGLFAAESMFHRVRDASKVAIVYLVAHLRARGYRLLDIQQWTPHTGSLGAIEIPRMEYLRRLATVVDKPVTFGDSLEGALLPSDQQ
jgi:leucyl/phenylalanyl-tRNA--protein transferase